MTDLDDPGLLDDVHPRAVLAELFARQVRADPRAVAVQHAGKVLTRGELDDWSDTIAADLQAVGVRPGHLVGLAVERGPVAIAAVLGLIKAGAGYLALDPDLPRRRQRALISAAAPVALIVQDHLDRLPTHHLPTVWADEAGPGEAARPEAPPPDDDGSRVFHVVSTSGTTGSPKAVRIGYAAVLNRLRWMWTDHPFPAGAAVLIHKSYGLVASPWEMLGGLLQGIRSVSLRRDELLDPVLLTDAVLDRRVTHLYLTPQLITGLLDELDRRMSAAPDIALVTSGADTLPVDLVHRFRRRLPGATLLNLYGATETASNTAAFDTARLAEDAVTVPVGRPVAGAELSVRDRHLRPVPIGVRGEVCVAGPPLALGYLGDAPDGAERFVRMPDGSVLHRTGDVGRWNADRQLEIIGRLDNQVKVRGYRVVLEDVEAAIAEAPNVTAAGVHAAPRAGDTVLIACVTGTKDLEIAALRAYLRERLPDYMVPSRVHRVAALPANSAGKLDRTRLADLAVDAERPVAVRTLTPRGPLQSALAMCWEELLGRGPAEAEEDFLDAGGHSVLVVRLIGRLEKATGVNLPLREVLENPTFGGIATALQRRAAT
ncbi:AMP-binding protein [Actinomadura sp. 9N215]|uniref:non-ribosomal peptide synthetase n=1 Tax=Actinomadura sp. 9N215 TaxID=3375150 RepID=UPI00379B4D63